MRRFLGTLVALLAISQYACAATTTLLQTGTWTQGHAPMYAVGGGSQPIVQDSGPAGGGAVGLGMSEGLYVMQGVGNPPFSATGTGPSGTNLCDYDAPTTNPTGYHYLCLAPNPGLMLYGSGGSAAALPFSINTIGPLSFTAQGVTRTFPWLQGPNPTAVGNLALWGDTAGQTLTSVPMSGDCTLATNGAITCTKSGGTAFGTMAFQNASGVAITGGTITGMPTPLNPSDVANKSYADAISTGLKVLPSSALATTGALPNTPTYSNGTLGVGATLTANTNTTLSVDSTSATLNTVVLVKNEATASHNGIYTVTQAGDGSHPWILTRATYFDIAAQMQFQSYTFVTGGATLANTSYTLAAAITTVGTDAVTWNLFSSGTSGIGYGGTSTGSANAQVISPTNFSASDGQQVAFTAGFTNTGATTLNAGTGALPVQLATPTGPSALSGGEIHVNNRVVALYQGGTFYVLNPTEILPTSSGGTGYAGAAWAQGQLFGLTLSNSGGGTTAIDIAAGTVRDSTNADFMSLASALTGKVLASSWTVGNGGGFLDTGSVTNAWYHVYIIKREDTGVVDAIASLSASAPTLPANYTIYRRVGSILRTAGSIKLFSQLGDEFLWLTSIADANNLNVGNTAQLITLTVPTGIQVNALYRSSYNNTSGSDGVIFTSPNETDQDPANNWQWDIFTAGTGLSAAGRFNVRTNTSGQIRARTQNVGGTNKLYIGTFGWIDTRGRLY